MTPTDRLNAYAQETSSDFVVDTFPGGVLVKFPVTDSYGPRSGVGDTFDQAAENLLRKVGR